MSTILPLTGNESGAEVMRQIAPDVVAAYPITPQTELMHRFADYVADGKVPTELILVESEHSAMSACVGASAAGARVMTATSSQGMALMWEILYIAAALRLPIVMPLVNRSLSAPINIHCDHSDSMGARDTGWLQLYCENCQEIYDTGIQAMKIAENKDVLLPVMVCYDGFILSHTVERVELLEDHEVKGFIGEHIADHPLLDVDNPVTYGPLDLQDFYFEHKRQEAEAMRNAKPVVLQVAEEYEVLSGRKYGLFEEYFSKDAEYIMVCLGSAAGTAKAAVDELRAAGENVGLLKLRVFRPFPAEELVAALADAKRIAVMDRADGVNSIGGPVFSEIRAALYGRSSAKISNYIYGLGGRDIDIEMMKSVFQDMKDGKYAEEAFYLGVRE
ncbi:pyruvate ferredoxin oxidoreductase [bacterium]|nr:pyruvate ferredoxin oxidoreductase [bacterium]